MKRFLPFLIVLMLLALFLAPVAVLAVGEAGGGDAGILSFLTPDGAAGDGSFVALLLQSMDPIAVIVAIALTQLFKIMLPSPIPGDRSTAVVPGRLSTRILPFIPILIGTATVCILHWGQPFRQLLVRGFVSGIAAAYFYRTTKVSIFGA